MNTPISNKVAYPAIVGAAWTIITWALGTYAHFSFPDYVAAAILTIIAAVTGWAVPGHSFEPGNPAPAPAPDGDTPATVAALAGTPDDPDSAASDAQAGKHAA